MANGLANLVANRLPLDSTRQALESLDTFGLDELNAEARSGHHEFDSLLVVMVGDAAVVQPQLEEAGFGPAIELNSDGESDEK